LVGGLDTLGDADAAHRAGHIDHRSDHREVLLVDAHAGDEPAVEFDNLRGQLLEPGQRRISGAEVVDREPRPPLDQFSHRLASGARQIDQSGFH
jgi:hypothetical protein